MARTGGLDPYIRAVAHAMRRKGQSEGEAIEMAVGILKNWAAGKGKVSAQTRARAAKAIAHWEAQKAAAHGSRDGFVGEWGTGGPGTTGPLATNYDLSDAGGMLPRSDGKHPKADEAHAFRGRDLTHCAVCGQSATAAIHHSRNAGSRASGAYASGHQFFGNQWTAAAQSGATPEQLQQLAAAMAAGGSGVHTSAGSKSGSHGGGSSAKKAAATKQAAAKKAATKAATAAKHTAATKTLLQKKTASLAASAQSAARTLELAQSAQKNNPSAVNQAKVKLAQLEAARVKAEQNVVALQTRQIGGDKSVTNKLVQDAADNAANATAAVNDAKNALASTQVGSAAAAKVQSLKKAVGTAQTQAAKNRQLASKAKTQAAKDSYNAKAAAYQQAAVKLETTLAQVQGHRHAGPGHSPVPTGHVNGNPTRARMAHKKRFVTEAAALEGHLHAAVGTLFDRQEKITISRLTGRRGKRMLAGFRADQPPEDQQPPPSQPTPDASSIFDTVFWAGETAKAVRPILDSAGQSSAQRVADQLGQQPVRSSLDAIDQVMANRTNRLSGQVTNTTWQQIQQALQDGIANGDGTAQLADRVRHVFQVARSRAELVARTEAIGSLNEAANVYANSLPAGTVGSKEWLAVHDTRTRETHRIADGQKVALTMPFVVGGSLMNHPGDPTAPPSEVCNCRCSTLYLPGPQPRPAATTPIQEAA